LGSSPARKQRKHDLTRNKCLEQPKVGNKSPTSWFEH
jgi:hypothetical protein